VLAPRSIAISRPDASGALTIAPTAFVPLIVVARDEHGRTVDPGAPYVFVTRDSTIASVNSAGVVTGRRIGTTYVLATLQLSALTLTDSIRVNVSGF
jgi:hypothetical protein